MFEEIVGYDVYGPVKIGGAPMVAKNVAGDLISEGITTVDSNKKNTVTSCVHVKLGKVLLCTTEATVRLGGRTSGFRVRNEGTFVTWQPDVESKKKEQRHYRRLTKVPRQR